MNKASACSAAVAVRRLCLIVCVAGRPRPQEQIRNKAYIFVPTPQCKQPPLKHEPQSAQDLHRDTDSTTHHKKNEYSCNDKNVIIMKDCPYCKSKINSSASVCPYCHSKIHDALTISDIAWLIKIPFTVIAWCFKPSRLKWIIRIVVCLLAALYILEKCAPM